MCPISSTGPAPKCPLESLIGDIDNLEEIYDVMSRVYGFTPSLSVTYMRSSSSRVTVIDSIDDGSIFVISSMLFSMPFMNMRGDSYGLPVAGVRVVGLRSLLLLAYCSVTYYFYIGHAGCAVMFTFGCASVASCLVMTILEVDSLSSLQNKAELLTGGQCGRYRIMIDRLKTAKATAGDCCKVCASGVTSMPAMKYFIAVTDSKSHLHVH